MLYSTVCTIDNAVESDILEAWSFYNVYIMRKLANQSSLEEVRLMQPPSVFLLATEPLYRSR